MLRVGVVADPQYADVDPAGTRFYRDSIAKLQVAVDHFNSQSLACCLNLGDLIDRSWSSFSEITRPLAASRHPFYHVLGNHDFDVLDHLKPRVPGRLGLGERYRTLDYERWRFVLLDTTDISPYVHATGSAEQQAALAAMQRAKESHLPQAQPWNGAVSQRQLDWFIQVCAEAGRQDQRVIVCGHHPIFPHDAHTIWNADQLLELMRTTPQVVAWWNGHQHAGAYAVWEGIPFVTFHGMVETPDTNAFATVELHSDRLVIQGVGREPSREVRWRTS